MPKLVQKLTRPRFALERPKSDAFGPVLKLFGSTCFAEAPRQFYSHSPGPEYPVLRTSLNECPIGMVGKSLI